MNASALLVIAGLLVTMQGATLSLLVSISSRVTDLGDRVSRLEGIVSRRRDFPVPTHLPQRRREPK